ncbi:Response regulator receiver domain-containing protein [Thermanaeromonas toyohensis ToBE]|uniref:Stage 0 sporulation protein A homolog n=1 Tax=Thermanaeromonas toyohensis ToBE TaxID=698762 RepID=A0A1W1VZ59_9FIRM|nr:response regulator [Thermanaeromonas toyohensis]SMB98649.1 Response regulator receiver domain-containing protein [Thermanaeromonas toyohensis ToBE]
MLRPGIKILVIEDDPNSARLLHDLLTRQGAIVVCENNGPAAMARIEKENFDLILLDLRLPGQNGFVVAEHLRRHPASANLPIIVISAFADRQNRLRAYEAGADIFLSKPIDVQELLLIIKNQVDRKFFKGSVNWAP